MESDLPTLKVLLDRDVQRHIVLYLVSTQDTVQFISGLQEARSVLARNLSLELVLSVTLSALFVDEVKLTQA